VSDLGVAPVRLDGRVERSRRTRTALVDAMLALQEEGDLAPSGQRVADRAGISARTMYLHFSDMESLYAEAGERFLLTLGALGGPLLVAGTLAARVDAFCHRRAVQLEKLLPIFRAARIRQPFSAALQSNRDRYVVAGDEEIDVTFAPELAALPARERATLRSALHVATCAAAWDVLRDDRGLDPAPAADVLRCTVTGLLA
jgi:TetR/AcrR family transcriptional regulator of autoinduction and epiphytic fitness